MLEVKVEYLNVSQGEAPSRPETIVYTESRRDPVSDGRSPEFTGNRLQIPSPLLVLSEGLISELCLLSAWR
jgi:hypothetical protein